VAAAQSKTAASKAAEGTVEDSVWAKLQSENHIPPLEFQGISLKEPTKRQIDAWREAKTNEEGERALFADQYDAIHALFNDQPSHVWENFNTLYLKHMFGTTGDEDLKG